MFGCPLRSLASPSLQRFARLALTSVAAMALFASSQTASAQQKLTTEAIIGDSVSEPNSPKYSDISDAIRFYKNRDIPNAQLLLETAKRKHPKLPPAAIMLAKMHLQAGQSNAVRTALNQSVSEAADDPEPYLMLAESALAGNRVIEADALFDKAIRLTQGYDANLNRKRSFVIRAYNGRAVVNQRRSMWEAAEKDLRVWLETDPENAAAHGLLGNVMFMLERPRDGLKSFAEAQKLDSKRPSPYVTAGVVLQRRGDNAQAVEYFRRAYQDDRTDEIVVTQFANSLVINGEPKEAIKVIEGGLRDKELADTFNLWLLRGVAARIEGNNEQAEKAYLRALALEPTNRDIFLQLTYLFADRKDEVSLRRAGQYADMNRRLNENNPDAQIAFAWVLEQSKQPRRAQEVLRKALQLGAPSPDSLLHVAKMFLARDQVDQAKQLLTTAIEKDQRIFIGKQEAETLLASL